jgi:hypothetical protein
MPHSRLLRAGLLTAMVDGLFASVSTAFYHSTVTRLWQGVASTVLGPRAFELGMRSVALGLLMHVTVAFTWSAVFLWVAMRLRPVRAALASRYGVVKVASIYGPCIWLCMSLGVIPLLTHRPPAITGRWWIQLVGHFPFVGLPIVATSARE